VQLKKKENVGIGKDMAEIDTVLCQSDVYSVFRKRTSPERLSGGSSSIRNQRCFSLNGYFISKTTAAVNRITIISYGNG
jgi:hypothetical protein